MTTATSPANLHPLRKPSTEDDEDRHYNGVSFASTTYLPWVIGSLRINGFDLSRMGTSGVGVVRGHNYDNVVGAVKRVYKEGPIFRADWRLPKRPFNQTTFDQLDSGVLRGISVGGNIVLGSLEIDNPDETDFDKALFSCDVVLVEQSLTVAPADVTSGVDRTVSDALERDAAVFDTVISPVGITTRDNPALLQRLQGMVNEHNSTVAIRRAQTMATQNQIQDIPAEVIERAIAAQLERSESLKALTQLPSEIAKLNETIELESKSNMEYRAKLDKLQFGGAQVLQLGTWNPNDPMIDLGVVLRLTRTDDSILPPIGSDKMISFEESIIERSELSKRGPNVLATVPFMALAERERQIQLRRSTMAQAGGTVATPVNNIDVLGNGGLVLASWSPILSRMDVRFVGSGEAKAPWATAQPSAAAGAEGSAIGITNLIMNDVAYRPKSIASAYEITSSLRAVDDGQFEAVARMAIMDVTYDQLTSQVLVGGGTDEITGIWNKTGVTEHEYGAAPANLDRDDILDWYDAVRLSKTDGSAFTAVLSTNLWKLCERTPRAVEGHQQRRATPRSACICLEPTMPHEGRMEREMAYLYQDLAPTGATDPGLFFKADRAIVWLFGGGFDVEYVPQLARKDVFKLCLEANMEMHRPAENAARIKRS